jgi:hypothetical protein
MTRRRLTEDFVHHHKAIRDRTGNNPFGIRQAQVRYPELAISIRELEALWRVFERHRWFAKHRFIVQAHPEFDRAYNDYQNRWRQHVSAALYYTPPDEEFTRWLEEELKSLVEAKEESASQSQKAEEEEEWDFDPERHSAASLIEGVAIYIRDSKADQEPFFSRAAGAFDWLSATVGVELSQIEKRWQEFLPPRPPKPPPPRPPKPPPPPPAA